MVGASFSLRLYTEKRSLKRKALAMAHQVVIRYMGRKLKLAATKKTAARNIQPVALCWPAKSMVTRETQVNL
jgi:uncharacterized protein with von Willebrand factor type A (vWA) domain